MSCTCEFCLLVSAYKNYADKLKKTENDTGLDQAALKMFGVKSYHDLSDSRREYLVSEAIKSFTESAEDKRERQEEDKGSGNLMSFIRDLFAGSGAEIIETDDGIVIAPEGMEGVEEMKRTGKLSHDLEAVAERIKKARNRQNN